jgi:hypothetical protein
MTNMRVKVRQRAPLAVGLVLFAAACGGDYLSLLREAQRHPSTAGAIPPSEGSDGGSPDNLGGTGEAGSAGTAGGGGRAGGGGMAGGGGIAGGGNGSAAGSPGSGYSSAVDADILTRWNQIADQQASTFDFHWSEVDQFPHPTFKGGTAEAYRAFAEVLLAFFAAGDNFDFLSAHHRFDVSLRYIFPSGQSGLDTSFRKLATYFASASSFGDIPVTTRTSLQRFADRMGP